MELHQLRYFCAVAEHENITKAADALHISQPALSRSIKRLEEEMGVELFDRIGRSIVLNDKGKVFLVAAQSAIKSVDTVGQTLERYVREQSSTLNLRTPVYLGDDENIISSFMKKYPDIYVRRAITPTPFIESEVPDLSFFASFERHTESNHVLVGKENIVLAVALDHPLAKASTVRLADLRYEKFVTVLPCKVRNVIDGMFAEVGIEPHYVVEDQNCFSVSRLVARGMGIALLPEITWLTSYDRENVKILTLSDVHRMRNMYLKWPEGVRVSRAALLFKDHLIEHYRSLGAYPEEE